MTIPNRNTLSTMCCPPCGRRDRRAGGATQLALLKQEADERLRSAKTPGTGSMAHRAEVRRSGAGGAPRGEQGHRHGQAAGRPSQGVAELPKRVDWIKGDARRSGRAENRAERVPIPPSTIRHRAFKASPSASTPLAQGHPPGVRARPGGRPPPPRHGGCPAPASRVPDVLARRVRPR